MQKKSCERQEKLQGSNFNRDIIEIEKQKKDETIESHGIRKQLLYYVGNSNRDSPEKKNESELNIPYYFKEDDKTNKIVFQ